VSHPQPIDAAHVARSGGWNEHVARGQTLRRRIEIQQSLLRLEHHAVFRFFINLDLRVVRAHVALCACAGQARNPHRTRVSRVANGTGSDSAIGVGLATLWHCSHPLIMADPPSICTNGCGGRRVPPGW
jgi:hypothetical protein